MTAGKQMSTVSTTMLQISNFPNITFEGKGGQRDSDFDMAIFKNPEYSNTLQNGNKDTRSNLFKPGRGFNKREMPTTITISERISGF